VSTSEYLLEPEQMEAIRAAFAKACEALGLNNTADAMTEIVADPARLCDSEIAALSGQRQAS
jgi:hypothetical protein